MITAEVAILRDRANDEATPEEEILAGLAMIAAVGGVEFTTSSHDIDVVDDHPRGIIVDDMAERQSDLRMPAPLNVLYTTKRIFLKREHADNLRHDANRYMVYGHTFTRIGLLVVSGARYHLDHLRDDNKVVTAHEAGHALGVKSTNPTADGIHCMDPKCVMSATTEMEPIEPQYNTPRLEKDIFAGTYIPPAAKVLGSEFCDGCCHFAKASVPFMLELHNRLFKITRQQSISRETSQCI